MALITLDEVSIGFRGPNLLDNVTARIEPGQRIGLLGRNGAGKTTLLKMLAGDIAPDHGQIQVADQAKVARLTQDVPDDLRGTIAEVVIQGFDAEAVADESTRWAAEHAVESTLSKMQLDPNADVASLSSGMKRRVLLAKAIVADPELLLLDEPTNHLDIESILWLEDFLARWPKTLLFITHDRSFLQRLANRIWEVDRGNLFDWTCDYPTFLKRKEAALQAEEKQNALFDKRLAEEEAWIRQGIKARRTRNEGRVRRLKEMRLQRGQRQNRHGTAKIEVQEAIRSGALVAKLDEVSFAYGDHSIIDDFTSVVMRGDKVGVIGPNGAGKSTLLKLLLGKLQPTQGEIKLGTNLQVAYFDQLRDTLDPEKTVQENVGESSDQIKIGNKTKHVLGYLQDYLFTPERARTKVKFISGGERNRALLAKLMTQPANVLVLDEPTNDLDSETLELLEELLIDYEGTVLLVSHDRSFLNNVVTSTIVFEEGTIRQYVGGYDDWQAAVARRQTEVSEKTTPAKKATKEKAPETPSTEPEKRKLSYKEKRELESLPERIEQLELEIAQIHETMADPGFYQNPGDQIAKTTQQLESLQSELSNAFERWEELES